MNKHIFAIDPGPDLSAYVAWNGARIIRFGHVSNYQLRCLLMGLDASTCECVAIEEIASYGMAVGKDVFVTCRQSGRFEEIAATRIVPCRYITRKDVKMHICGSMKAKDANICAALVDRFGDRARHGQFSKGTKRDPGFFYGFASHHWAAFAVAVTAWDTREECGK